MREKQRTKDRTIRGLNQQERKEKEGLKKSFHRVLPGGKALETEGLREASSVGQDQEVGIKVKVCRLVY